SASLPFSAGWAPADATRETPDLLEVALDAATYAPGDVARLRIVSEEPGTALVTVLSDRVIDLRLVEVAGGGDDAGGAGDGRGVGGSGGETTVDLPVTDEWGAGVYVTASLIRPSDGPEHLPTRSLGLAHASVDPGARALDVEITAPGETRSNTLLP